MEDILQESRFSWKVKIFKSIQDLLDPSVQV